MGSRYVEVCLGCGKMCLGWGEKCGKGVGVGAMGVGLGLGKGEVGVRGSVGRRMVSQSRTPSPTPLHPTPRSTLPDPNPPDPNSPTPSSTPPSPTPLTPIPPTQTPPNCVFWPQRAFSLLLNRGLNARFVEYLEETKLEFFQT